MIYAAGFACLAVLALLTLPSAAHRIQKQVQDEMDYALADKGLSGIEAQVDGQVVTLAYGKDVADVVMADTPEALAPRMGWAVDAAEHLRGGLYAEPGKDGLVWGPATRIRVNQSSVDALAQQIAARNAAQKKVQVQAKACTDDVAAAVAERKLHFISGSFDLTPDSEVILDDVYRVIKACPGNLVLHVEGHTDDVGSDADNIALSTSRAASAARGLVARGLDEQRVVSAGLGETQPVADNATPEGQAANRRVMFIMTPPETPEEAAP